MYIKMTDDAHVICSQCEDRPELQASLEEMETKRMVAAIAHGIEDYTRMRIQLALCDTCVDKIERSSSY